MGNFEAWWRISAIAILALATGGALLGTFVSFAMSDWNQLLAGTVGGAIIGGVLSVLLGVGLLIHWLANA